jgi:hypothetical protein
MVEISGYVPSAEDRAGKTKIPVSLTSASLKDDAGCSDPALRQILGDDSYG